jgi:heme-degrading monooxygenase HmoA
MFNVIFEVHPHADRFEQYLELAQHLKPRLTAIEGFINNERFASLTRPGWVLSLSSWRDEKSLVRWRTDSEHHRVQVEGRVRVFDDYRLQIGEVISDSSVGTDELPQQHRFDETEVGAAKAVGLTEMRCVASSAQAYIQAVLGSSNADGLVADIELYESIYSPAKFCALSSWRSALVAKRWDTGTSADVELLRHRCVRVVRTYGMTDRREAPQFHADQCPFVHSPS